MILIVCVDDDYGMGFNRRRQSSDRVVTAEIVKMSAGKKLWIDPYSAPLFPEGTELFDHKNFLSLADKGEFCFAECIDVSPWINKAEEIVIFRWNRKYPSDVKFPFHMLLSGWKLFSTKEFAGSSHETVTMEAYKR